ncbi:hypothetical protein XANCAGTX0491_003857 [Xanthoria calcicola]
MVFHSRYAASGSPPGHFRGNPTKPIDSINGQTITKVAMSQTLKHATPVSRHSWDVATLHQSVPIGGTADQLSTAGEVSTIRCNWANQNGQPPISQQQAMSAMGMTPATPFGHHHFPTQLAFRATTWWSSRHLSGRPPPAALGTSPVSSPPMPTIKFEKLIRILAVGQGGSAGWPI